MTKTSVIPADFPLEVRISLDICLFAEGVAPPIFSPRKMLAAKPSMVTGAFTFQPRKLHSAKRCLAHPCKTTGCVKIRPAHLLGLELRQSELRGSGCRFFLEQRSIQADLRSKNALSDGPEPGIWKGAGLPVRRVAGRASSISRFGRMKTNGGKVPPRHRSSESASTPSAVRRTNSTISCPGAGR